MAKIAGYILQHEIDRGDAWLNSVDPEYTDRYAVHRQCAWNFEALDPDELHCLEKIPLDDASLHVCHYCNRKLSEPARFSFEVVKIDDLVSQYFEALDAGLDMRIEKIMQFAMKRGVLDELNDVICMLHMKMDTESDVPYVQQVEQYRKRG